MFHNPAMPIGPHNDSPADALLQAWVDRRELALIAVERTRIPMVVTDPRREDNPIVLANQAFLDLAGYDASEVIGRNCRMLQGPLTKVEAINQIRDAIADGRDLTVELINYRKDGSTFWNRLHLSPVHDQAGQLINFMGSQLDISELRRAREFEAVEHRLLKEVDHRAMNVLAIVEGIVRLSDADDPRQYAMAVQGRVQALARAHALLAEQEWRPVGLSALVATQVLFHASSRVSVQGPEVALPGEVVQPLALVLHELMLNAVRHGALSTGTGTLTLAWAQDRADSRLRLKWSESGGPPPKVKRKDGFGAKMVGATIRRQLRGDMVQTWSQDGTQVEFSIPITA